MLGSSQFYFSKKTVAKNQSEATTESALKPIESEQPHSPPIIAVRAFTTGASIAAADVRTIVTALDSGSPNFELRIGSSDSYEGLLLLSDWYQIIDPI